MAAALLLAAPLLPSPASGEQGKGQEEPGQRYAVGLISHDFAGDFFRLVPREEWPYLRHPKVEVRWENVEPRRGGFDWSGIDAQVEALRDNGFDDLLILVNLPVPAWARDQSRGKLARRAPPLDPEDWRRYVRALASRYAEVADFYEILNEPGWDADSQAMQAYGSYHFGGQVETEYLAMLKAAQEEIKKADPGGMVVCGALNCDASGQPENGLWLADLMTDPDHQVQGYCDAFALHPYYRPDLWGRSYELMRGLLDAKGIDREIFVTEIGWPHASDKEPKPEGLREQQEAMGIKGLGSLFAAGCRRVWVYQDLDDPPGQDYEGLYYGLFDHLGDPLPAWYEFRGWFRACQMLNELEEML